MQAGEGGGSGAPLYAPAWGRAEAVVQHCTRPHGGGVPYFGSSLLPPFTLLTNPEVLDPALPSLTLTIVTPFNLLARAPSC
jgi:hypothetical protein